MNQFYKYMQDCELLKFVYDFCVSHKIELRIEILEFIESKDTSFWTSFYY